MPASRSHAAADADDPDRTAKKSETSAPWHALGPDTVLDHFGVDPATGLCAAQVRLARVAHGPNALPERPPPGPLALLVHSLRSPLILLLFGGAALALLLGHHTDAMAIAGVLVANAAVGAWHEGQARRSMDALRHWAQALVRVRRDATEGWIPASELVPGDILLLSAGDAVGADARLIEAARFQTSEAALTGESVPVSKSVEPVAVDASPPDRRGMVFSGTFATAGRATAVVTAIGRKTEFGRIAELAQTTRPPETPLEQRTRDFGRWLACFAVGASISVVLLGLLRRHPSEDILMVALSQMVSLVPEGLPVAVTIALAVGMQRMASGGALVRNLAAVETIGESTVICTDKTGTLTSNEMTVRRAWVPPGDSFLVDGNGFEPRGAVLDSTGNPRRDGGRLTELAEAGLLCSDARLVPPAVPDGGWGVDGDPTEGALVAFAAKVGIDPDRHREAHPRDAERPFDAEKQRMATRHRGPDGTTRVFVKGSPEALVRLLDPTDRATAASVEQCANAWASQGLRVLAIGVVEGDPWTQRVSGDLLAGHVHMLGLVGQIDPPRPEVPSAVVACRAAGIRPVMVTGDHLLTAMAVAREVGIAGQGDSGVDGASMETWDEETLARRVSEIPVFARVAPGQKLRIVAALQQRGAVVAMTGDGVNDGPALARADVGVAMGIGGTDVARVCADVVLVDNRFATLVEGIRQGRVVSENLRRVLIFILSTSVDEVLLLMLTLGTGLPVPLSAVQILWINLVTEATLTLNLVMDPPDGDVLSKPPLPRQRPLVDKGMAWRIARMACSALVVCFVWFAVRVGSGVGIESARSEIFLLLVLCQWFQLLSAQSETQSVFRIVWSRRPWLAGGLALSVVLQALVLYAPPLTQWFGTESFSSTELPRLLAAGSIVLWLEEARKAVSRLREARRTGLRSGKAGVAGV